MTRSRPTILAMVALSLILASCGVDPGRAKVVAANAAVTVLRDRFVTWDAAHQKEIADKAASYPEYKGEITKYRGERDEVVAAFFDAYQTVTRTAVDTTDTNLLVMALSLRRLYNAVTTLAPSLGSTH